jgi:hypothetical protein
MSNFFSSLHNEQRREVEYIPITSFPPSLMPKKKKKATKRKKAKKTKKRR